MSAQIRAQRAENRAPVGKLRRFLQNKGIGGETIRYVIVGGLTTLVNFCIFALMTKIMNIDVTVSNVTSISVSILFAYVTNKLFVFRQRGKTGIVLFLEFLKFVGSRLFTMALEIGVVLLFVEVFKLDELVGKLASMFLVVIANYVISKAFVFRK